MVFFGVCDVFSLGYGFSIELFLCICRLFSMGFLGFSRICWCSSGVFGWLLRVLGC